MSAPLDIDALSFNLQRGLEDEAWRRLAIAQGLQHAAKFSWGRCAAQTVNVYQAAMDH
jgi:glycosyltransferase involved in cell wall biosynthesis